MRDFHQIFDIAAARKGGAEALEEMLGDGPLSAQALAAIPEDRWLSQMTRCVFQAGFNWKVIEAKWAGFEAAFKGFDVGACAMMDDDWFDRLMADNGVVRNGPKLAQCVEMRRSAGAAGRWRRGCGAGRLGVGGLHRVG